MTAQYRGAGSGSPEPALTDYWAHMQVAASRHTTPQSTTLGLHPVIHVPMDHYSFTDPEGWMAELAMLAD